MAVDRINLLGSEKQERPKLKVSPAVLGMAAGGLAFVALAGLSVKRVQSITLMKAELASVKKAYDAKQSELNLLRKDAAPSDADKRASIVQSFVSKKLVLSDILKEISLATPEGTWLTSLVVKAEKDSKQVLITAEAPTSQLMSEFLSSLERSYYLRDARFKFSEQLTATAPPLQRFQFEAVVRDRVFGADPEWAPVTATSTGNGSPSATGNGEAK